MAHPKYRCADYSTHETLKEAKAHAAKLSKCVESADRHITSLIYQCVDCKAFYGVYLPYTPKVRDKAVKPEKQTAEIISFPTIKTLRTNPGLIEGKIRRAA
jgi:hypothetical protein